MGLSGEVAVLGRAGDAVVSECVVPFVSGAGLNVNVQATLGDLARRLLAAEG